MTTTAAGTARTAGTTQRALLRQQLQSSRRTSLEETKKDETNQQPTVESMEALRARLAPSIWTVADRQNDPAVTQHIVSHKLLNETEQAKGLQLCGKFLYSTIQRAVQVGDMGEQTFVATGDIDSMWTRDSVSSTCSRKQIRLKKVLLLSI